MATLARPVPARAVNGYRVLVLALITLLGVGLLTGLGIWQLERRSWKLELMRRVDSRVHAEPHAIPVSAASDPGSHEYERVELGGTYLPGLDTWVHASTERGSGYWILSPLRTTEGPVILVNRGFVPLDVPRKALLQESTVHLTGLLRVSEEAGHWPRKNDPARDQWYSRDVPGIARRQGLASVQPYFVDAAVVVGSGDSTASPGVESRVGGSENVERVRPIPGLTVVRFRNAHLSYALTWFTLALMTAMAGLYAIRGEFSGHARQP